MGEQPGEKEIEVLIMREGMYPEIAEVDNACFNREGNLRTAQNMELLRESIPQGCLVVRKEQKLIGYSFAKLLGSVGYIGPIGIHPEQQAKGYAKELLSACIVRLKEAGCRSIGLETMPESGKHIGLYQSAGFELTFPSVTYQCPEQFVFGDMSQVISGAEVELQRVEEFDRKLAEEYDGLHILGDIRAALKVNKEQVFFYSDRNEIKGVLFRCKELYRYVYGAFLKDASNLEQFLTLFSALRQVHTEPLKLRVNSRYKKAAQLQQYGFLALGSHARLTLKGYHGIYETPEPEGFILKGWVG